MHVCYGKSEPPGRLMVVRVEQHLREDHLAHGGLSIRALAS